MENSMKELAELFIKRHNYTPGDVDVKRDIKYEVGEFLDGCRSLLDNYEEYAWKYYDDVYTWVCKLLEIAPEE